MTAPDNSLFSMLDILYISASTFDRWGVIGCEPRRTRITQTLKINRIANKQWTSNHFRTKRNPLLERVS
jgi:hypothetical protein